jgi:hypothetical protein
VFTARYLSLPQNVTTCGATKMGRNSLNPVAEVFIGQFIETVCYAGSGHLPFWQLHTNRGVLQDLYLLVVLANRQA